MKTELLKAGVMAVFICSSIVFFSCGKPDPLESETDDFIQLINQVENTSVPLSFDFNGDTLIVAEMSNGFSVYDISDPMSFARIKHVLDFDNCSKVHVEDKFNALFISTEIQTYVYYLDSLALNASSILDDFGSNHLLTSVHYGEVDDEGEALETDYMKVFKADGFSSFHLVKVFLDTLDFGGNGTWYFEKEEDETYLDWQIPVVPSGLSFVNDNRTIAVSLREVGVGFADVSSEPVWISDVDTPGYAAGLAQSGNYLYVADGYFGVAVIDISDIQNPVYKKNFKVEGFNHITKVVAYEDQVVLMDEYDGLIFLDSSNPDELKEVGQVEIREPTDLKFNPYDCYLYVTSFEKGVTIFNLLY